MQLLLCSLQYKRILYNVLEKLYIFTNELCDKCQYTFRQQNISFIYFDAGKQFLSTDCDANSFCILLQLIGVLRQISFIAPI